MQKTCNAFHWTLYVILASFIAWGVWYEAIQMNLFGTSPEIPIIHPAKKAPEMTEPKKTVQLPEKPTAKLVLDESKNCALTKFEGYATVKAWYEDSDMYSEKSRVLRVASDDLYKLPERVREWSDGTPIESLLPDTVPAPLNKVLLKASSAKPADVKIVGLKVYCEGFPGVTLAQK